MKQQNKELQEENKTLHSKGIDLQLQVDDLLEELSRKEAEWCSKEEKLMLEVSYSPARRGLQLLCNKDGGVHLNF